jgi:hypothetical protein
VESPEGTRITWSEHLDARGRTHWSRHLEDSGIDRVAAKEAIERDLGAKAVTGELAPGPNVIAIVIQAKEVRYSAYLFADGRVNVGRSIVLE